MTETQGPIFPVDVFHLLSNELCDRKDFATLYNCVVSSRYFGSSGAVAALYRISASSPVTDGGDESSIVDQEISVQRCSILWRSICLSAFGKTLHPYCRYVRVLELDSLKNLLNDDKFAGRVATQFFSQELARFHFVRPAITRRRLPQLDVKRVLTAIGNEITRHAPLLVEIRDSTVDSVISDAETLREWLPRLSYLQSITFWDGKVLADESVRNTINTQCPQLKALGIYQCSSDEGDAILAAFINGMADGTLEHFMNFSNSHIGVQTCLALNTQGKSLTSLELTLSREGILALAYLQGCAGLKKLKIEASQNVGDLKATQNDVYVEIIGWFQKCDSLQTVHMKNLKSAPDLLLPILLNPNVVLEDLEIEATEATLYIIKDHQDFHQALSQQRSLRRLILTADPETITRDELETLINTLCSLKELREMKLMEPTSDFFTDEHLNLLTAHLHNLKELYIGGLGLSDSIWSGLAQLTSLNSLSLVGMTRFTADGILGFISELGHGNSNMVLTTQYQDPEHPIEAPEQDLIRKTILEKVDGRFEYQLLRDPNALGESDFDSD